jgi:hypothetical protein
MLDDGTDKRRRHRQHSRVLRLLGAYGMDDWEKALWFVVPCEALGGARPVDRLLDLRRHPSDDGVAEVVAAAERRRDWF